MPHLKTKMKKSGSTGIMLALLLFMSGSCGGGADSYLEPARETLISRIELSTAEESDLSPQVVPELKPLALSIIQVYNDERKEPMTPQEVAERITWEVPANSELSIVEDDESGAVKLQGIGTAELTAVYNADPRSGNRRLLSNSLAFTTVEAVMTDIKVVPAVAYAIGCPFSNLPNSELAEGCLMQFQAMGLYNNGSVVDLTEAVAWSSEDPEKANLLAAIALEDHVGKDWHDIRSRFIEDNGLETREGLVLGYSIGSFRLTASYSGLGGFVDTAEPVTVVSPRLYSLESHITMPDNSICNDRCTLYENTRIKIDTHGTYTNSVQSDITRQTLISADDESNIEMLRTTTGSYTGIVRIGYGAADKVVFTLSADDSVRKISTSIAREEVLDIHQQSPVGDLGAAVYRVSNTAVYFMLEASYSNDGFTVLDKLSRQERLNTVTYSEWILTNDDGVHPALEWSDPECKWETGKGYHLRTTDQLAGGGTIEAIPSDSGIEGVEWRVEINNESSVPISLTISPGNTNGVATVHDGEAGEETQFSALALFDNQTSGLLETGEIIWSSLPSRCEVELINPENQPCIDSLTGVAVTYQDLLITAATSGFNPDISASLIVNVTPSVLNTISLVPGEASIYGKDSLQFLSLGLFRNGLTHRLPDACVSWSVEPSHALIGGSGLLTAVDISSDQAVTVRAESVEGCGGLETTGRIIADGLSGETLLWIKHLPIITVVASQTNPAEDVGSITITFNASKTIDREITVPYRVSGTALSGVDHTLSSGYVTFTALTDQVVTTAGIHEDLLDEDHETLVITLLDEGLINARLSEQPEEQQLVVTIHDNDDPPVLTVSSLHSSINEGDHLVLDLNLDAPSGRDITVQFEVGGEVSPDDYRLVDASGDRLMIPAGNTSSQLVIEARYRDTKEADELLILDVSADHATVGTPQVAATIVDIDSLEFINQPEIPPLSFGIFFAYTPQVNAEAGLALVFSIINPPVWSDPFATATGVLSGTTPNEYTLSQGVMICVEDGAGDSDCLPPFTIVVGQP